MDLTKCKFLLGMVCLFYFMTAANADTFNECDGINPGTYVPSSESCSLYIYCDNDDSVLYECEDGEYFDKDSQSCDAKENVHCHLDDDTEGGQEGEEEEPEEAEEDEDSEQSENPPQVTTAAPATTTTTILPTVATATTNAEIINLPPVVKESCPLIDDPYQIVLVASKNSCSNYFVCYHGYALEMHCVDHLHFNAVTGKCDFPEKAHCKIPTQSFSATNKCLPHVTDLFPHPQKCNYFFYCVKGFQTLQQCPFFYGWDIERRTCVHMRQAKCYRNTL